MNRKEFLDTLYNLYDIYNIDDMELYNTTYWRRKYNIDVSIITALQRFIIAERDTTVTSNTDNLLTFCLAAIPSNSLDESERLQYLYDLAINVCKNECEKIGTITEDEFMKHIKQLPELYDLETPITEYNNRDFHKLREKYDIYFDMGPESFRNAILMIHNGKDIGPFSMSHLYSFFWDPIDKNKQPPYPMNCFDAALYGITRFLDDIGRKKRRM